MARPFGCLNLTAEERAAIRAMFRDGVRVKEILRRSGRAETTLWRVVKGLRRKRPTSPPGRHAKRNDKIVALAERGWSRAKICEHVGLKPSALGEVIAEHPRVRELLRRGMRPAAVAHRFRMEMSTVRRIIARDSDDKIIALIERGWSRTKVCEKFGLSRRRLQQLIVGHPRIRQLLRRGARPTATAQRFKIRMSTVLRIMDRRVERTRTRWWLD